MLRGEGATFVYSPQNSSQHAMTCRFRYKLDLFNEISALLGIVSTKK